MKAGSRLLDLLFPPKCPFCRALLNDGETVLCEKCRTGLPVNSLEIEIQDAGSCRAPLIYAETVRKALVRFKFSGCSWYARPFAAILLPYVKEEKSELVTWIPVSLRRKIERGYDQAELLAVYSAKEAGIPCVSLLRKKHTKHQSGTSSKEERRKNIQGAFSVPEPEKVRGKSVLLIDDICTTGATLSEAAAALLAAGAAEVRCLALAITPEYKTNR